MRKSKFTEAQRLDILDEHDAVNRVAELQQWWIEYNTCWPHDNIEKITPDMYEIENQKFYYSAVGWNGKRTPQRTPKVPPAY